ncbi:hypothetical protein J6590_083055 [Homalodisca vitripennis]|nr:hypothetical protein J6590_083055 [Homalodisca vitripennis]
MKEALSMSGIRLVHVELVVGLTNHSPSVVHCLDAKFWTEHSVASEGLQANKNSGIILNDYQYYLITVLEHL